MTHFTLNEFESEPGFDWYTICARLKRAPQAGAQILSEMGVRFNQLIRMAQPPQRGEPYGRKVLFASAEFEVMLASWTKGAQCAPHDHGFSNGWVWLVQGQFIEEHFVFDGDLRSTGERPHPVSASILSVGVRDIHAMRAPEGGLTLHIYNPPIQKMKVYDRQSRRILTVTDNCGAWIPEDQRLIVEVKPWPSLPADSI